MPNLLNVIDLEATCWRGPPPEGQANEIIEIGICILDTDTLERTQKRSILVKPDHSEVSEFCTELTSLTPELVATGISFVRACEVLARDYDTKFRPWASWGDYDRKQIWAQCQAAGILYPFGGGHTNAKRSYAEGYGLRRQMGMTTALEHAKLPLTGRHHRGVDDAWNIAALIAHLIEEGKWAKAEV